jgi:hypothetical protein
MDGRLRLFRLVSAGVIAVKIDAHGAASHAVSIISADQVAATE